MNTDELHKTDLSVKQQAAVKVRYEDVIVVKTQMNAYAPTLFILSVLSVFICDSSRG